LQQERIGISANSKVGGRSANKESFPKSNRKNRRLFNCSGSGVGRTHFYGRSFSPISEIIDVCFFELFFY